MQQDTLELAAGEVVVYNSTADTLGPGEQADATRIVEVVVADGQITHRPGDLDAGVVNRAYAVTMYLERTELRAHRSLHQDAEAAVQFAAIVLQRVTVDHPVLRAAAVARDDPKGFGRPGSADHIPADTHASGATHRHLLVIAAD